MSYREYADYHGDTSTQRRAVVMGGGGFIGGHLIERLKQEGYWVRGVDLKHHEHRPTAADDFVIGDLRDRKVVEAVIDTGVDEVYQLAADMGGAEYVFSGDYDSNIMSNSAQININVCDVAVARGVGRVFYSSSACIYPEHNQLDPDNPVCTEVSAYPAAPDSEYGWEKLFSERLYLAYARNHGLSVRIARFHNIFGPYGTWQGGREKAPAAMCRKVASAVDGGEIEVFGDGKQTRSFLYIDECLEGVCRLMQSDFVGPVNIGSDEMVSINQLVEIVAEVANKKVSLRHIDGPLGVRGRTSDNTLIQERLGWRPTAPLRDGLAKTYAWIDDELKKQQLQEGRPKATVIGIGRLGLGLALLGSHGGFDVLGVDTRQDYVDALNSRKFVSKEPQYTELLREAPSFRATTSLDEGLAHSDLIFVLVPTPNSGGERFYDHAHLSSLLQNINRRRVVGKHIVVCCTVMPGYLKEVGEGLLRDCEGCSLSYGPEFVAQGEVVKGYVNPSLMLLGTESVEAMRLVQSYYCGFVRTSPKWAVMKPIEAELTKLGLNGYVTTKIAYANMLGDTCIQNGARPEVVLGAIGTDPRIGNKCFRYGDAFGGPCFPRDTRALRQVVMRAGIPDGLLKETTHSNEAHIGYQAQQIAASGKLSSSAGNRYVLRDVCYKPNLAVPMIDESARLRMGAALVAAGVKVTVEDREDVIEEVRKEWGSRFSYSVSH